ncbi:DUF2326 domain-containing protein [Martelella lutilitoris]|uniref:DUF2326 domain-containing protein n=1 Tax=Martelella lutilitoris TaxID=2583532 RepID=A0A5C4JMZ0_9HYPH|nr:DUF2326 domain-containing protein [Martelella lutilitoris]TNB46833.1 DUF2326 domain-containing protein [Martelella lutilitoris]
MQIERITSNQPDVFRPIDFNAGEQSDILNVIFGDVRRPKDNSRDSHNLGKTKLIEVIDFLFLSNPGKGSLFTKHVDRFQELVFLMELRLASNDFVGIRRSVAEPTIIDLIRSEERLGHDVDDPQRSWSHVGVTLERARQILDGWFAMTILGEYSYRKAITYFLRSQNDWQDELQLQKFSVGKDRDWKPFVGQLFGYDHGLLVSKYNLDTEVQELEKEHSRLEVRVDLRDADLPKVRAELAALEGSITETEDQLDRFQFDETEQRLIKELVEGIEARISELNQIAYNARYDAEQISRALEHSDRLDLDRIDDVFGEAELVFPGQLRQSYEALLSFRARITRERKAALKKRLEEINTQLEEIRAERSKLDEERRNRLVIIDSDDTIEKFKALQNSLAKLRRRRDRHQSDVDMLEELGRAARKLREKKRERDAMVDKINDMVSASSSRLMRFQALFDKYCRAVLSLEGIFSFRVNTSGNLEYEIGLGLDGRRGETSAQGDGTSYRKLLCALFDLALLRTNRGERFFQFTYHDGVLEGLDTRKKRAFLDLVRREISEGGLQYILTAISSDLPTDELGRPIPFDDAEIVLRLDDTGNDGRLFRGPAF